MPSARKALRRPPAGAGSERSALVRVRRHSRFPPCRRPPARAGCSAFPSPVALRRGCRCRPQAAAAARRPARRACPAAAAAAREAWGRTGDSSRNCGCCRRRAVLPSGPRVTRQIDSIEVSAEQVQRRGLGTRRQPHAVDELQEHLVPVAGVGEPSVDDGSDGIHAGAPVLAQHERADAIVVVALVHHPDRGEGREQALGICSVRLGDGKGVAPRAHQDRRHLRRATRSPRQQACRQRELPRTRRSCTGCWNTACTCVWYLRTPLAKGMRVTQYSPTTRFQVS